MDSDNSGGGYICKYEREPINGPIFPTIDFGISGVSKSDEDRRAHDILYVFVLMYLNIPTTVSDLLQTFSGLMR
jgi:hypothetical protein